MKDCKVLDRCLVLLSAFQDTSRDDEYVDILMDLTNSIKSALDSWRKDPDSEQTLLWHQTITCLRFFNPRLKSVCPEVLSYFETRIRFCLMELRSQGDDSREKATFSIPDSVLITMESLLDLFELHESSNELPIIDITDGIDRLLSQVLLFRTIILQEDQEKVLGMCRSVLAKKLEITKSQTSEISSTRELKRTVLELNDLLNGCVLRLFISTMADVDKEPLPSSGEPFCESSFDLLMDRIIQLGVIAIGFTESPSVQLSIRSAVASLESLDLHLVPMLRKYERPQDPKIAACENTLQQTMARHWREETTKLSVSIHKIIDTKALTSCFLDWVSERLNRNEVLAKEQQRLSPESLASFDDIFRICQVFLQHLRLNAIGGSDSGSAVAGQGTEFLLRHHRKDMEIMLNECRAALKYANTLEVHRIFKRFRLLLHTIEKLHKVLPTDEDGDQAVTENTPKPLIASENIAKSESAKEDCLNIEKELQRMVLDETENDVQEYFNSFGITMAEPTLGFYARRPTKQHNESPSMIPQVSSILKMGSRPKGRQNSLFRTALKNASRKIANANECQSGENSLQLDITDILNELTKISHTLKGN